MFLRWLARARQTPKHEGAWRDPKRRDMYWRAILVEAVRLNGRPRQRVVDLGGVTESAIVAKKDDALHQFWDKIEARLRDAHQLSEGDRRRIISALLAKVPCPMPAASCSVRQEGGLITLPCCRASDRLGFF
jgi:hypothetical protein